MNCCIECPNPWCPRERGHPFRNNGSLAIHLSLSQTCQDCETAIQHGSNVFLNANIDSQQDNDEKSNDFPDNANENINFNGDDDE